MTEGQVTKDILRLLTKLLELRTSSTEYKKLRSTVFETIKEQRAAGLISDIELAELYWHSERAGRMIKKLIARYRPVRPKEVCLWCRECGSIEYVPAQTWEAYTRFTKYPDPHYRCPDCAPKYTVLGTPVETTPEQYHTYIKSKEWKQKREQVAADAGYECVVCGRHDYHVHVHHKHYHTVGRERPVDLCILCARCHAKLHGHIQ